MRNCQQTCCKDWFVLKVLVCILLCMPCEWFPPLILKIFKIRFPSVCVLSSKFKCVLAFSVTCFIGVTAVAVMSDNCLIGKKSFTFFTIPRLVCFLCTALIHSSTFISPFSFCSSQTESVGVDHRQFNTNIIQFFSAYL